ncbi:MAG TPA: flagellar motor stator protein MotA [Rhodospirillales bacterium]|jgi:chemotaxis protein MotA|nr:flagellar motor stator protein MotA [Rhodospirillales bacterium]
MLFIVGLIIVFGSVVGGFLGAGGHLAVLFQPFEFIIIFGAALGSFIIANPLPVVMGTLKSIGPLLKGSKFKKESYVELLSMLFAIFKLAKTKGDLALESHIDNPAESPLFAGYPGFTSNHHAMEFICDNLRIFTLGGGNPHELEAIMDVELEAMHAEQHIITAAVTTVGDAMPALGIVAAVLGVIHTMGSISQPPEVLGHLIGAALVGTFSGILFAYGLIAPVAKSLEKTFAAEAEYLNCIKAGLIAHLQGYAPQVSIEFARKTLPGALKPSFHEIDEALQAVQLP